MLGKLLLWLRCSLPDSLLSSMVLVQVEDRPDFMRLRERLSQMLAASLAMSFGALLIPLRFLAASLWASILRVREVEASGDLVIGNTLAEFRLRSLDRGTV